MFGAHGRRAVPRCSDRAPARARSGNSPTSGGRILLQPPHRASDTSRPGPECAPVDHCSRPPPRVGEMAGKDAPIASAARPAIMSGHHHTHQRSGTRHTLLSWAGSPIPSTYDSEDSQFLRDKPLPGPPSLPEGASRAVISLASQIVGLGQLVLIILRAGTKWQRCLLLSLQPRHGPDLLHRGRDDVPGTAEQDQDVPERLRRIRWITLSLAFVAGGSLWLGWHGRLGPSLLGVALFSGLNSLVQALLWYRAVAASIRQRVLDLRGGRSRRTCSRWPS